jgi:hypothetical protein
MTQESYRHPITPPPELLKHWEDQHFDEGENYDVMLTQAYQAGADQELEACCAEMDGWGDIHYSSGRKFSKDLRYHRRPKPPSLKEQALLAINTAVADDRLSADVARVVRRALEQLSDHK